VAGVRAIVLVILIAVVVPFWIYLVFFTQLPMAALAGIALVILLLLSTATAWSAMAIHKRPDDQDDKPGS
jgi:MFS superfamily sulfate permease-like transporter